MASQVHLRPLSRCDLPIVEPWFEDSQTSRYLGERDWPGRMLILLSAWSAPSFGAPLKLVPTAS
jgi:hypothetical protein